VSNEQIDKSTAAEELYAEAGQWHVNTGGETIHAKRMPGKWRTVKWVSAAIWILFFLGPYVRWDGRQAILWDIPARQYHIFGATILPQDFWMLSLLLLFFAILLAVVTALAGRVWCGFFCFQTVWRNWRVSRPPAGSWIRPPWTSPSSGSRPSSICCGH
jgi:hypothetical protein